jgi:hypothetical protein
MLPRPPWDEKPAEGRKVPLVMLRSEKSEPAPMAEAVFASADGRDGRIETRSKRERFFVVAFGFDFALSTFGLV